MAATIIILAQSSKIAEPVNTKAAPQLAKLEVAQIPEVTLSGEIAPNGSHGTLKLSIRNDSKKPIDGVVVSIDNETLRIDKTTAKGTAWRVVNRKIHPDMDALHQKHNHPVLPGEEVSLTDEQILLDEGYVAVQKMTARIAYVRFVDGSHVGEDRRGRLLTDVTIGAEKYKRWLTAKYLAAGRSKEVLASLLNAPGLPSDLDVPKGGPERTGAFIYRNHFRRALAENTLNPDAILK